MTIRILNVEALAGLKTLPEASVHCIVSSPPYWRQRDYGMAGQLGLEQTPEEYVDRLTAIFAECRRVLRPDGTAWVNLGDKWASGGNGGGGNVKANKGGRSPPTGYKDKDLVGVPWMLAFAMRAEGWYLRQCNIWAKPNCMPESVTDRSTSSHEYVFHFSKNNDYWYDADAARTPPAPSSETRLAQNVEAQEDSARANGGGKTNGPMKAVQRKAEGTPRGDGSRWNENGGRGLKPRTDRQRGHSRKHNGFNDRWDAMPVAEQRAMGANLRSVWWISPARYREGHYAVMPNALAEICIAAGCPAGGTVLDPFGGAGTTGLVADRMGRDAILIDLNPEYADMARKRIKGDSPLLAEVNQ
jgi:DNA modification methylase